MTLRHHVPLVLGKLRLELRRAHVKPDQARALLRRVCGDVDFVLEVGLRRLRRHVDAGSREVELPAVVDTAQAGLFVTAEEQAGTTMRAILRDDADVAVSVAEGD